MGASLVQRLTKDGHKCVVYDVNSTAVKKIVGRGVQVAVSLDERRLVEDSDLSEFTERVSDSRDRTKEVHKRWIQRKRPRS